LSNPTETQGGGGDAAAALNLSPEELASVAKAREGLSDVDPTNVSNEAPADAPQRPDWLPEKFWDVETGEGNYENLAKSYAELEKTRSAPTEEAAAEPAVAEDGKITKPEPAAEAENPLTDLINKAQSEFGASQEVTAETIEALEKAGLPKEVFETYLKGVQAITQNTTQEIYGFAGGQEHYEAMAGWAAETLSDEDLQAFNAALDNPMLRETAVRGLHSRWKDAVPSEGTMTSPSGSQTATGDIFKSKAEALAAIKDPRYQTDAVYRDAVIDRLQRSQGQGFRMHDEGMFARRIVNA
jgi:hypothetical protein